MSHGVRILNRQWVMNQAIANPAEPQHYVSTAQGAIAGPGKYTVKVIAGMFDGLYTAEIRTPDGRYVETHRLRSPQDVKAWVEKYVYQGQHGMYDVLPRLQWKEGKSSTVRYTTSFTVKKRTGNPPSRRRLSPVERMADRTPSFMHPELDRVETWDDLIYQIELEIDLFESDSLRQSGEGSPWTAAQYKRAKAFLAEVKAAAQRATNPPYRRRGGSSSGYSSLPGAYSPRWVPQHLMAELSNLWHLSRVPHQGRYERMLWTSREFHKEHPELSETAIYKDLSASLEGWA